MSRLGKTHQGVFGRCICGAELKVATAFGHSGTPNAEDSVTICLFCARLYRCTTPPLVAPPGTLWLVPVTLEELEKDGHPDSIAKLKEAIRFVKSAHPN